MMWTDDNIMHKLDVITGSVQWATDELYTSFSAPITSTANSNFSFGPLGSD